MSLSHKIEEFFHEHEGDGEFSCWNRELPYVFVPPGKADGTKVLIYITKPSVVATLLSTNVLSDDIALIGRQGLPDSGVLAWIASTRRVRNVAFVGDIDPVDVLICCYLTIKLSNRCSVVNVGAIDSIVKLASRTGQECPILVLSEGESESLVLLSQCLASLGDVVPPSAQRMMMSGRKIELEALVGGEQSVVVRYRRSVLRAVNRLKSR